MYIKSLANRGDFELISGDDRIYRVMYDRKFTLVACTQFGERFIEVRQRNALSMKYDIIINGDIMGEILFKFSGKSTIKLFREYGDWSFKRKGLFNQRFFITNFETGESFSLKPKINWRRLSYGYSIDMPLDMQDERDCLEMIFFAVFTANVYLRVMGSSAS